MIDFLYTVIIYPITLTIEVMFELFNKIFKNTGISILGISFVVSMLCLPLYHIAEKWQKKEQDTVKKFKPMVDRIKTVFTGSKRHMILSTFYRQNNYHPVYALRSSLGLLIQVPFFIAGYTYISNLQAIKGVSLFFISDLSRADGFASIGSLTFNILPVIMTLINLISAVIYTRGFLLKDKIQVYIIPFIFLVLLYNSPAALVIYWTMNNVISLIKNIINKLKNPFKITYILFLFASVLLIFFMLFLHKGVIKKRIIFCILIFIFSIFPVYKKLISLLYNKYLSYFSDNKNLTIIYFIFSLSMVIITGFSIPSAVISSSPNEFIFSNNMQNPVFLLLYSFSFMFGCFVFWPTCIYFLFDKKIKVFITATFMGLTVYSLINAFIFHGNYGIISNLFQFSSTGVLNHSSLYNIFNIISLFAGIFIIIFILSKRMLKVIIYSGMIIFLSLSVFSIFNIYKINNSFSYYKKMAGSGNKISYLDKIYTLSKEDNNIVVIMIDSAVNGYLKHIFDHRPELYDIYDGFTLYPNTVAFSTHTLMAVPPIWGGYEYTPLEMNKNRKKSLKEKHNQALLMLPAILSETNSKMIITDPSWANYEWIPDTSIYKNLNNVNAFNANGRYTTYWLKENNLSNQDTVLNIIQRNMLLFTFLKITPSSLRFIVYDRGIYWGGKKIAGNNTSFFDNYSVLDYLCELTDFNAKESQILFITNNLTHSHIFLQYPDYIPVQEVTDIGPGFYNQHPAYHTNSAFYILLGKWLNSLKENGVYDNTRIIIVSDHGANVNADISNTPYPIGNERLEYYNSLLLVKDFNSKGTLKEDFTFMTNADVPLLILDGIIKNPVNPFTGNKLTPDNKKDGVIITINHKPMPGHHKRNYFNIQNDQWVLVRDNILNNENWTYADIE